MKKIITIHTAKHYFGFIISVWKLNILIAINKDID